MASYCGRGTDSLGIQDAPTVKKLGGSGDNLRHRESSARIWTPERPIRSTHYAGQKQEGDRCAPSAGQCRMFERFG